MLLLRKDELGNESLEDFPNWQEEHKLEHYFVETRSKQLETIILKTRWCGWQRWWSQILEEALIVVRAIFGIDFRLGRHRE